MLPDPDDRPSGLSEGVVISSIPLDVACDLCVPIDPIRLWAQAVLWASMPKTAVNEHCNPLARENDIRLAAQIL